MKVTLPAVLLGLMLLSVPAAAQTNTTIVAGQAVGPLRLGANVNEAMPVLGSLVDKADSRSRKYTLYQWPLRPILIIAERETNRIVAISAQMTDAYQTDKGITGGSERQAVEAAYGQTFTTENDPTSVALVYNAMGITFEVGKVGVMAGRVIAISIFPPNQWRQIISEIQ